MSTQELRELLIEKIKQTNNNDLLEEASRLLNVEVEDSEMYVLSEPEKKDLEEARKQIKNGERFTHEEANQLVQKWLEK